MGGGGWWGVGDGGWRRGWWGVRDGGEGARVLGMELVRVLENGAVGVLEAVTWRGRMCERILWQWLQ